MCAAVDGDLAARHAFERAITARDRAIATLNAATEALSTAEADLQRARERVGRLPIAPATPPDQTV
jgi:hypothetical protein